eukprot:gene10840-12050_t
MCRGACMKTVDPPRTTGGGEGRREWADWENDAHLFDDLETDLEEEEWESPSPSFVAQVSPHAEGSNQDAVRAIPRRKINTDWSGWSEEPPYFEDPVDDEDEDVPALSSPSPLKGVVTATPASQRASNIHSPVSVSKDEEITKDEVDALRDRVERLETQFTRDLAGIDRATYLTTLVILTSMFLTFQYVLFTKLL